MSSASQKKVVITLSDLAPADPFLAELITVALKPVSENHLAAYRLIFNGGEYQEFPHLHFHLVFGTLKP